MSFIDLCSRVIFYQNLPCWNTSYVYHTDNIGEMFVENVQVVVLFFEYPNGTVYLSILDLSTHLYMSLHFIFFSLKVNR